MGQGRINQAGRRYRTKSFSSPFQQNLELAKNLRSSSKEDRVAEYIYLLLTLALIVRKDHSGRLVVVKKETRESTFNNGLLVALA